MKRVSGKEKLLAAARALMLEKGFGATAVDEICLRAGVSKGTFFYYFQSKPELGKAVVEYHTQLGNAAMAAADFAGEADPLRRLLGHVDFIIEAVQDPVRDGCLLGVLTEELVLELPEVVAECGRSFQGWIAYLAETIEQWNQAQTPKARVDSLGLAQFFVSTYEGALILAKANKDKACIAVALEHYKKYLKTIMGGAG